MIVSSCWIECVIGRLSTALTPTNCSPQSPSPAAPCPLCCENIFAPLVPRPQTPEEIDALARRAREFLEVVIRGLQT